MPNILEGLDNGFVSKYNAAMVPRMDRDRLYTMKLSSGGGGKILQV